MSFIRHNILEMKKIFVDIVETGLPVRANFINQTELRLKLANFRTYLFPGSFGIYAFHDFGRVWVENDNDNKMLSGYGGGLWFSPLKRILISLGYGTSKEDRLITFGLGWKF